MKYCFLLAVLLLSNVCTAQNKKDSGSIFKIVSFQDKKYFVCVVNPKQYSIDAHNKMENGKGVYDFNTLAKAKQKELVFMVNGGMYQEDRSPLGLLVTEGVTRHAINKRTGKGNFYVPAPNGIFLVNKNDSACVITRDRYNEKKYRPRIATQSGPMLVIDGKLNNGFTKGSKNLNIRNGVGVDKKGNVVFIISEEPVNFYELAELFRDQFECANALYLDGFVSTYYAPGLQSAPRSWHRLGVFLTVSRKIK